MGECRTGRHGLLRVFRASELAPTFPSPRSLALTSVWRRHARRTCPTTANTDLQPARFHHIGITAQHSLTELQRLVSLRDLRADLVRLDGEIAAMRATVATAVSAAGNGGNGDGGTLPASIPSQSLSQAPSQSQQQTYDNIDDISRIERLVKAREMTRANLEKRVGAMSG